MRVDVQPQTVSALLPESRGAPAEREVLVVVHHDAEVRRRLMRLLAPLGHVEAVAELEAALTRFGSRILVAVCEAAPKGSMSGLAFARAVRSQSQYPAVPVVLLTPADEVPELEACGDAPGIECLGEPFRDRDLYCRMRDLAELSRHRRAIVATEQRTRELFRASPEPMCLLELVRDERGQAVDATFIDVNPAYESLFRAAREARVGRRFSQLPGGAEFVPLLQHAVANGLTLRREMWMPQIERDVRLLLFQTSGDRFGIMFTDLTEQKRTEQERERTLLASRAATDEAVRVRRQLEAVFEAVQDGLLVADRDGGTLLANRALARILGFPDPSALKTTLKEFDALFELSSLDGEVLPVERWPMSRVLRGEPVSELELTCRRRDTGQRWVFSFIGTPVYDEAGARTMGLMVTRNITRRTRMEAELSATRDQLVDELVTMTRLHRIATRFMQEGDLPALLGEILDAAMAITGAQMGNVRLVDEATGELKLTQCKGYETPLKDYCARCQEGPTCHRSLQQNARVVVDDVRASPLFEGSPALQAVLAAGVRSVQSSPLTTRSGKVVGMLTTHGKGPLKLGERETKQLDLLARQTADIVERAKMLEERAHWRARAEWEEKLRLSEALFRSTVENMPIGLAIYGRDRRMVYVNPSLLEFMGKPASHFLGRPIEESWAGEHGTKHGERVNEVFTTGERLSYELELPAGPERARSVRRVTLAPVHDASGVVQQVLSLSQDITAEVELVAGLRREDRRKDEFIGVLSHELRNPLGAIHRSLELAQRAPGEEQKARAMEIIERQTGQLARLVDDLLDVTRVTHGKISLVREPVDLREVVHDAVEDHLAAFERAGVRLGVRLPDGPVPVSGDRSRLTQVVGNLLHNASKFTPNGGETSIELSADLASKRARLVVKDSGAGMEPALIESLFRPFSQAPQTLARSQGGLGLGLALVRQLVGLHEGEVVATSTGPGEGSEFTVWLPVVEVVPTLPPPAVTEPAVTGGRRVLIVEDHADAATALEELLELDGHEVHVAADGLTGLALARTVKPDVVLCDIGLPGLDGLAVARAIREDEALTGMVLVALTGYTSAADQAKAREAGFEHLLPKPVSLDRLTRILSTVPPFPSGREEPPQVP